MDVELETLIDGQWPDVCERIDAFLRAHSRTSPDAVAAVRTRRGSSILDVVRHWHVECTLILRAGRLSPAEQEQIREAIRKLDGWNKNLIRFGVGWGKPVDARVLIYA